MEAGIHVDARSIESHYIVLMGAIGMCTWYRGGHYGRPNCNVKY